METRKTSEMTLFQQEHQGLQPGELAVSCQMTQPMTTASTLLVDVPFIHYKQTARVQEVEIPVDVTHVHVEKVEVQAPYEIPMIHPREVGVHQQIKRNNPSPVDVFTVQKYQLPRLRPKYYDVEVPIYVPRYVEVPVPSHFVALNRELLPGTLPLGPPVQSDLPTAPVLANNQIYSLAQASVPPPQHSSKRRSEAGEERFVSHPHFLVRTPEKDAEASELACFFPADATGADLMNSSAAPMRPAFFLTPSHTQSSPAAPLDAAATLHQRNPRAATSEARLGSSVLEVPTVTGLQGLATLGRAVSSRSISGSTDRAASSICSPVVAATRVEGEAALHQQEGAEEHPEKTMLYKEGRPPVIETVA